MLAILGLMLAFVAGRGPMHSQRLDLHVTQRELAASLRLARSRAIAQNRTVTWIPAPSGYSLDGGPLRRLPAHVAINAGGPISFAPDGSSNGGVVRLRGGNLRTAIEIDWLTGQVRLAETDVDPALGFQQQ